MTRLIFFTLFFCSFFMYGQTDNYTIIGKVVDDESKSIEHGNVIALSTKDSSIIKGTFFMSGQFEINGISDTDFFLKITVLGFQEQFQQVSRQKNDTLIDVGTIQLTINNTLKEVEVISKVPLFERDGEKVKVNVENSALSSVGTALDVLKKSPTVKVDNSDNVSVFGKGGAVIYVDGQQITSVDILKTISSTEIKEIEIISNPSAKYDASGKAVINIITKKNNLEGYSGNLIQIASYGKGLLTYTGLRFNYKRKKWSTFISYGIPHGQDWKTDEYSRSAKNNDSTTIVMKNNISTVLNQTSFHNYRVGATYAFDSASSLGIQYTGYYYQSTNYSDNINDVFKSAVPLLTIQTNTISKPIKSMNSANIYFAKKIDTLQSEYSLTAQYGSFNSTNSDEITQQIFKGNNSNEQTKRNSGINAIQIFTAQAGLIKAFNKSWKLESGIKGSDISNQSKINLENYSAGVWISDPAYFNGFKYSESILAGYSQLRYSKNEINVRVGGRVEYSDSDGLSKISGQQVIKREDLNLFPSAFLGYDLTKNINTSLTYSSRIIRPSFQDLDPFVNFIDSLSSFRGNPYLLPSYTHSLEASVIYMQQASIVFGYSRTNGEMALVVDKLNDGTSAFIATTKNLNFLETYSVGAIIPYELGWWTTYNYLGYMKNTFTYKSGGDVVQNKKPTFYMYLYDEFRVKKILSIEVTFEYTSAGADGIFTFEPFSNLSANIKKTFLKDKLTFRLTANDILSTSFKTGSSNVNGYNVSYISKANTHYFGVSLNYRFGKLKENVDKEKGVNKEEYDRIKKGK